MSHNGVRRKRGFRVGLVRFTSLRLQPFCVLNLDLFATVKKALDRAGPDGLLVKNVKDRLDRSDDDMQRNSAILPRLDQRPIERTQKKVLPPPPDKRVFDLGEIVEVIQLFDPKLPGPANSFLAMNR